MAIMSWIVVFVYALKLEGNIPNGILALVGISFGQLATNLLDDFIDYKRLNDKSQQCKCAYIKSGQACLKDVLKVVIIYCCISVLTGIILTFRAGLPVIWLAGLGGLIVLSYSYLSKYGFSEIAVGISFGPLLFEGVYYVMLKTFSLEVFIMSLAVVMFTIGLMYVHTVLDYETDENSHKKTLACRLNSKTKAINGIWIVYGLGYCFTIILAIITVNYYFMLSFLLIPLIFDMYKSLKTYTSGEDVEKFYFRLLKARNLMVYYSSIIILSIILYN